MNPTISNRDEWLAARKELLGKEKAHSKSREELTRTRQRLPWYKIEKDYKFNGSNGEQSLSDLFGDKSQLLVQHFMFPADWEDGCPSCSFMADSYNQSIEHINARDVAVAAVSIAPLAKIEAFKKKMGWSFNWVSSEGSDFNRDFHVSLTEEELANGTGYYNFQENVAFPVSEAPGISVFAKKDGEVYHTYSTYARGLENSISAYHYLDLVPKGRDEDKLNYGMEWLRHRGKY